MIVTAVERQPRRRRVNVFVDGRFTLSLDAGLAAERGLQPGRELAADELADLGAADARRSAWQAALRLLSYRPRSERELSDRLARRGFAPPAVGETLERLRHLGYLDDDAFARFWTETRQAARPRARWVITGELRRRGVAQGAAERATEGIEDEEAAYEAAQRRLRVLRGLEYLTFRERLGRFLTSRGFSYEVARRTIQRCWEELAEETQR